MVKRSDLRDVSFLSLLAARAEDVTKVSQYRMLKMMGPFAIMPDLLKWLDTELRDERERFFLRTQKIVNEHLPPGYMLMRPELKFWFAGNVCIRLVADAWRPPAEPVAAAFVQALYEVGANFNVDPPPDQRLLEAVIAIPMRLREQGMFKRANT